MGFGAGVGRDGSMVGGGVLVGNGSTASACLVAIAAGISKVASTLGTGSRGVEGNVGAGLGSGLDGEGEEDVEAEDEVSDELSSHPEISASTTKAGNRVRYNAHLGTVSESRMKCPLMNNALTRGSLLTRLYSHYTSYTTLVKT